MALPPELLEELQKISGLPLAAELGAAMNTQAGIADTKARGRAVSTLLSNAMIATENLQDAETLAGAYAKSLSVLGLVEENKTHTLSWQSVFDGAVAVGPYFATKANIDKAFRDAEGGVLIISEPYQCPEDMSPREFAQNNFSAMTHLFKKMDEVEDSFAAAVDELLSAGKNLRDIDRQMSHQNFENPRKPVVIIVGRKEDMENMVTDDPFPWGLRFAHKLGISAEATGSAPAAPAPQNPPPPKNA